MKGFKINIQKATLENTNFRKVLYTGKSSQLVLMSILPGEDIGNEMHDLDQFIRIEQGDAKAILNDGETVYELHDDDAIIIPAHTQHNIINTGTDDLKVYSIYSPPEHKDGVVVPTKADLIEEHFDGITTEN